MSSNCRRLPLGAGRQDRRGRPCSPPGCRVATRAEAIRSLAKAALPLSRPFFKALSQSWITSVRSLDSLGAEFLLGGLVEIGLAFVLRAGRNREKADSDRQQSQRQDRGDPASQAGKIQACHAEILHGETTICCAHYIPLQGRNRGQDGLGRVDQSVECGHGPSRSLHADVAGVLRRTYPASLRLGLRSGTAGVDQQVTRPEKRMRGPLRPDRRRHAPRWTFLIRGSASLFKGELLTTCTARCQASAGVVCGNSCVNSRTRSRLVCPPLRQRLRRIVRVPVDIIPQRLRKISLPGAERIGLRHAGTSRSIDLLQRSFRRPSGSRAGSLRPARAAARGTIRPAGRRVLVRSVGSGDQP